MKRESHYKRISSNEQNNIRRYFNTLHIAAKFFEKYFINKVVTYCTVDSKIDIYFSSSNFMHLCGIRYKKGSSSFFEDCLNQHIVLDDIEIKKDGTTIQKLQILSSISELIGENVYLTGAGRFLYLDFDYALKTRKQILALTLKDTKHRTVPQSLLDLKKQKTFLKGKPVVEIFSRNLKIEDETVDCLYKRECTYHK
ncbi:hypothetical protein KBI51_03215 [Aerococcaceae bacterium zg-ZUI334]|uniref:PBECR4 domain-containing protein n=1 Tax=Aerococcaceae bacterium zg-252 TaxID=2796928 RepID=UPI001B948B51|nr:hypothetical protein [Aerococcaceae bacterium zg-ZUI334]